MKKIYVAFSLLFLLFIVAACGDSDTNATADNEKTSADENVTNDHGLPDQLVLSVYPVGSGTYNDTAAIADVFTGEYQTQFRLLPSDTGIGRVAPLRDGTADYARIAEEYIYAFEGDLDFANKDWGPQNIQLVWAPLAPLGFAVKEDSGINEPKDLKGKKVPDMIANPSGNNKVDAYLAYGGLTRDDVEEVQISYGDQAEAFKAGQIDAIFFNAFGTPMVELDSSTGFKWISLTDDSPEVLERVAAVAPSTSILPVKNAAGTEDGEVIHPISYSVPIATYPDKSEEEVYTFVKSLVDQYDNYKDITVSLQDFDLDSVLKEPLIVPFHEGTVKFFEEAGVWTEEAESKNQELLERQEKLQSLWKEFIATAEGDNLHDEWNAYKEEHLD